MSNAIYTSITRYYEKYARACFNSLEKNYPNHPIVLVYANNLSEEFMGFVNTLHNFKIIPYVQFFTNNAQGPVKNDIIYNKYRLWSNEFDEYDTVLHLDVDTIVLKSLDHYFEHDDFFIITDGLEGYSPYAFSPIDTQLKNMLSDDHIDFNVDVRTPMGNAGVFTVPKKYRTQEHLNYLIYLTERYEKYLAYADQTVLTLWCYKNKIPITKSYGCNYIPHFSSVQETYRSLENIYLIHFANKKPDTINFLLWNYVPSKLAQDYADLFHKYLY